MSQLYFYPELGSFRNLVLGSSSRGPSAGVSGPRPAGKIFGFQRPGRSSTRCKRSMGAAGIRLTDCNWAFVFSVEGGG